jgi:phenylacetate-coenzyme A ligase PaaK-like adenylate-forming protein
MPCGRTLPLIDNVSGKSDDLLRVADGRVMHGQFATEPLLAITDVRQVQLVQLAPDRFLLRAVAKPSANRPDMSLALASGLRSKVGDQASAEVEWMDLIPPGANRKVKSVISEVN